MNTIKRGTDVQPIIKSCPEKITMDKKRVLIATINIEKSGLWTCGLYQNVIFIYKLLEIANYLPYFFVDEKTSKEFQSEYRVIDKRDWNAGPFRIYAFIEIGMISSSYIRSVMKNSGAKTFKLGLGNSLNIDTETVLFNKNAQFYTYITGNTDETLLSPHYDLQQEYCSIIDGIYPSVRVAPYVWDSVLIKEFQDTHKWEPNMPFSITIMEPNISFQKCSLVPIMICELFYRNNPGTFEGAIVVNGYNMTKHEYFNETILGNLDIHRKGKIHLIKRCALRQIYQTFKSNIVILHAVNNDYNYVFLEHLLMGFPVLHNYATLKQYGYYYEGDNILAGYKLLETVINFHKLNIKKYKERNLPLLQKFKIDNPENIIEWKKILDMKIV
jgi:hypothetical protein